MIFFSLLILQQLLCYVPGISKSNRFKLNVTWHSEAGLEMSGTAEADTRDEHDVYGCSRLLFTSPKRQPVTQSR